MILHDNYFLTINETDSHSMVLSHSPLFHSVFTLMIGFIGCFLNFLALIRLIFIFIQHRQLKKFQHVLSHRKYSFLLIFTFNSLWISFLCLISCIDERFFSESIITRIHLCSLYIFLWKFTLHFVPLLTIFILFRYHYFFHQQFRIKRAKTTTLNQILCTNLCFIIPFVLSLSWSIDGLWLWGTTDMKNFVPSSSTSNFTDVIQNDSISSSTSLRSYFGQNIICYLLINDDLNFTTRLLFLVQMDYILLFFLHLFGFFLEIILHIRLSCCLIAHRVTSSFLREQRMSLYVLYFLIGFTLPSLPFYFYRACEILFDAQFSTYQSEFINSSSFAQLLLLGVSFQPILYILLFLPSRYLLRLQCYTFVHIIPDEFFRENPLPSTIPCSELRRKYSSAKIYHRDSLNPFESHFPNGYLKARTLSVSNDHCSRKSSMLVEISEDSVSS